MSPWFSRRISLCGSEPKFSMTTSSSLSPRRRVSEPLLGLRSCISMLFLFSCFCVQNSSLISDFRCSKCPEICSIIVQKPPNAQIKHSLRNFEHSKWLIFPLSYRLLSLLCVNLAHSNRNAKHKCKKREPTALVVCQFSRRFCPQGESQGTVPQCDKSHRWDSPHDSPGLTRP